MIRILHSLCHKLILETIIVANCIAANQNFAKWKISSLKRLAKVTQLGTSPTEIQTHTCSGEKITWREKEYVIRGRAKRTNSILEKKKFFSWRWLTLPFGVRFLIICLSCHSERERERNLPSLIFSRQRSKVFIPFFSTLLYKPS